MRTAFLAVVALACSPGHSPLFAQDRAAAFDLKGGSRTAVKQQDPKAGPPPGVKAPEFAGDCLANALARPIGGSWLSIDNGIDLCRRAPSPDAPVACLEKALAKTTGGYTLSIDGGTTLCRGASVPDTPVACLGKALARPVAGYTLSIDGAVALCGGASAPDAPIDCLHRALAKPVGSLGNSVGTQQLSIDQGVSLCRG